jgi:hypothetical protein
LIAETRDNVRAKAHVKARANAQRNGCNCSRFSVHYRTIGAYQLFNKRLILSGKAPIKAIYRYKAFIACLPNEIRLSAIS